MNGSESAIVQPASVAGAFDAAIEWLVIALLAFMPLAFGVVSAGSELVVTGLAGAMAICLALKLALDRSSRLLWSWSYVPIGLFLALAAVQLIPLPIPMPVMRFQPIPGSYALG